MVPSQEKKLPKPGDEVRIVTKDDTLSGVLMPTPEYQKGIVVLKLDSGYNIGIEEKSISKMELLARHKADKEEQKQAEKKDKHAKLPDITILHTGGTIASKVDYKTGGVISRYSPDELLALFPELKDIAWVRSRLIRNMWSEDMRFSHYNILAKEVMEEAKKGVAGVIITHGTDTLHYSSAALAFSLGDIAIPVILVGSQRSSDRGSSDAAMNLLNAAYFITAVQGQFSGVGICMHENMNDDSCLILPACKTRKMHTSRRDAFRPINALPLARVDYRQKMVSRLDSSAPQWNKPKEKSGLKLFKEDLKIGVLKAHTNMYASEFLAYKGFPGLVIESMGLGQVPINEIDELTKEHTKIKKALKTLVDSGTIVVFAPQTLYGRVHMDVYQTARDLQEIGIIGHLSDMTPETTFIKLAWLLSNYPKEKAKELMLTNIRGELSGRSEPPGFLA